MYKESEMAYFLCALNNINGKRVKVNQDHMLFSSTPSTFTKKCFLTSSKGRHNKVLQSRDLYSHYIYKMCTSSVCNVSKVRVG